VVSEISLAVAGMVSCAECVRQWQMESDHRVPEGVEAVQDDVMSQDTHPVAGTRSHLRGKFCNVLVLTFPFPVLSSFK